MTIRISFPMLLLASIALNLSSQSGQAAPIEAVNFSGGLNYATTYALLPSTGTIGWQFTVSSPIIVTSLGYFDGVGMTNDHEVGIYNSAGTLLTSATVLPSDPLVASTGSQPGNGFRYDSSLSAPLSLYPGNTYTIGGQFLASDSDGFWVNASSVSSDGLVNYIPGGVYAYPDGGLTFPTTGADHPLAYFGPNFQFVTPEPTSGLLLGLGAVALFVLGRRAAHRRPVSSTSPSSE